MFPEWAWVANSEEGRKVEIPSLHWFLKHGALFPTLAKWLVEARTG